MLTLGLTDTQPTLPTSSEGASLAALAQAQQDMEHASFTPRRDPVHAFLPWAVSLLVHAGLVVVAIFIVWSSVRSADEQDIIVPIVQLGQTPGTPLQMKISQRIKTPTRSTRRIVTPTRPTPQIQVDTPNPLIGVAGTPAPRSNPFETASADTSAFKTRFFGTGGNARRIVFLVDASGSLIAELPSVILELKKTIAQLNEKQSFTVLFFQGDTVIEVPPRGLKKADAKTLEEVIAWMDLSNHHIVPEGKSSPIKALQLALKYKPQLLFLLSDNITGAGRYEVDQKRLLDEIDKANQAHTKINTIQFIYPDPLTGIGLKGTLELISQRSGGVYRFVDARELGLQ